MMWRDLVLKYHSDCSVTNGSWERGGYTRLGPKQAGQLGSSGSKPGEGCQWFSLWWDGVKGWTGIMETEKAGQNLYICCRYNCQNWVRCRR